MEVVDSPVTRVTIYKTTRHQISTDHNLPFTFVTFSHIRIFIYLKKQTRLIDSFTVNPAPKTSAFRPNVLKVLPFSQVQLKCILLSDFLAFQRHYNVQKSGYWVYITTFLSVSIKHSPSLEAKISSKCHKILNTVQNQKLHYRVPDSLTTFVVLKQLNPVQDYPIYLFIIHLILCSYLHLRLQNLLFLQFFPPKICTQFYPPHAGHMRPPSQCLQFVRYRFAL
jgi:hypothetical protein